MRFAGKFHASASSLLDRPAALRFAEVTASQTPGTPSQCSFHFFAASINFSPFFVPLSRRIPVTQAVPLPPPEIDSRPVQLSLPHLLAAGCPLIIAAQPLNSPTLYCP